MRAPEIFTETLPIIDKVPLIFYIPKCKEQVDLKIMIERYGGMTTDFHECFTFQIAPMSLERNGSLYFAGDIFSAKWLIDSVKEGRLLSNETYLEFANKDGSCLKLDFVAQKVRYTIREGIKVFELALANPESASGATFWLEIERQNMIPKRTGESMRNFWKTNRNRGLERYLQTAIAHEYDRFSHAFRPLLRPKTGTKEPTVIAQQAEARLFEQSLNKIDKVPVVPNHHKNSANDDAYIPPRGCVISYQQQKETENNLKCLFTAMEQVNPQKRKKKDQMKESQQNQEMIEDQENAEMLEDDDDKENEHFSANSQDSQDLKSCLSQDLLTMVESKGIVVTQKETGDKVNISSGKEAYYALLAQDMLNFAKDYDRDVAEVHKIFYQVSCNRDKLKSYLYGNEVKVWTTLEDLALKNDRSNRAYQVVLNDKGEQEVKEREAFLGLAK